MAKAAPLHIEKISIKNILGVEHVEFEPGKFNVITGGNGAGKTSVLTALRSIFDVEEGTLLRQGQERGEVVLLLSDGRELRRRVTENASNLYVEEDGVRQAKPATIAGGLVDVLSVNPVDFLAAKPKKRVEAMLEAMPMEANPARIREIVGDDSYDVGDGHALDVIKKAYDIVFDERRDTNRAKSQKESTITQLNATLPAKKDDQVDGNEEELELRLENIETAREAEMTRIDTKLTELRTASEEKVQAKRDEIARLQEQIAVLQGEVATEREAFAGVETRAGQQRERSNQRFNDERDPVRASLEVIRADRDAAIRATQTREQIAILRTEANTLEEDSARMTSALAKLDAYKAELLGALPVPGLEIVDGELIRHGIAFDRLNTAQKVEIAVEIAKLRAGELGIICVDGLELMDTEHFEAFRTQALESNLQMFVTRVADQPALTIESES